MEDKTKLKEYKAKLKEYLQKDRTLKNSIVSVVVTCQITKKKHLIKIKL